MGKGLYGPTVPERRKKQRPKRAPYTEASPVKIRRRDGTTEEHPAYDRAGFHEVVGNPEKRPRRQWR